MLFDKLLEILSPPTKTTLPSQNETFNGIFLDIASEAKDKVRAYWWWSIDVHKFESFQSLKVRKKTFRRQFVFYLLDIQEYFKIKNEGKDWKRAEIECYFPDIAGQTLAALVKSDLDFSSEEYIKLFNRFKTAEERKIGFLKYSPVKTLLGHLERKVKKSELAPELVVFLKEMTTWKTLKSGFNFYNSDNKEISKKIEKILFQFQKIHGEHPPFKLDEDQFGAYVNKSIDSLPIEIRKHWYSIFHHCTKAKGSKPTKKFYDDLNKQIDKLGPAQYLKMVHEWMGAFPKLEPMVVKHFNLTYEWETLVFLEDQNKAILKGLIWSLLRFQDTQTLDLAGIVAHKSFEKIPNIGAKATAIGNACIYVFANCESLEGIGHLSRLKLKVKQNNTKKLIENYLDEIATKRGIPPAQIEELAVPDYGVVDSAKSYDFEDYQFKISIQGVRKISQIWIKPDGKSQKTTPAFVKNDPALTQQLKQIKTEVKNIKNTLSTQKERIDRLFVRNRIMDWAHFNQYYLEHGIIGIISKDLLWQFKLNGDFITYYFHEGEWKTLSGSRLSATHNIEAVRIWHPVYCTLEENQQWRNLFNQLQKRQAIKQVYREIYLLTDAEMTTRTYSNRMAAHILKQHQFKALANSRDWQYTLTGAFDDGRGHQAATIYLKEHELEAQYWIEEVSDDTAMTYAGIWNYIATDQVRFLDNHGEVVELIRIPPIVLSEILRDTDLFVGVASIGNDPTWQDSGELVQTQYRDYWHNYSFGDLTEIAKTRKTILENLVPRLKIRDCATVEGKFLVVKGKLRTYKIHLGSTNILMEPNDQYLCIVPDRKSQNKNMKEIFLPFEGDNGLSIILSKAFLLAEDDKIKDPTITSQIKNR